MLNRMYELAVQSANGTYQNEVDRENLQSEVDALIEEIDRIAESANFNGITLLDGSYATDALTLQIGDTADDFNKLTMNIGAISSGAASMAISGVNIGNAASAADAIETIKDAINYVSTIRGDLGAVQNRLEHTVNNLSVMEENIQNAESRIRDTDVADEMMAYTKNNILIQSAQAMLAQANAVPQGVLQLLQ